MPSDLIPGSRSIKVDIAIIADIRVGDVAAPCHAAAASALVGAGYSVAIVPVITGAIPADPYRVDPDMADLLQAGTVRRVARGASIECSLALAFDARIFAAPLTGCPQIHATHRLVTIERPAALAMQARSDLDRLRARAEIAMGGSVNWCPTSITAHDAMAFAVPDWPVTDVVWAPVAPDLSHVQADAADRARPTIGRTRIARTRPTDVWPDVCLSSPLVALRARGEPTLASDVWPRAAPVENWSDKTLNMADFFAKLDLLFNPDVAANDPYPVEALMAISAGVIPCLPESYRELFGGAAIYGSDEELLQAAIKLKLDNQVMTSARQAGAALMKVVFSRDVFVARVKALVGAPERATFAPAVHAEPNTRVLFYSTNGIGMGHLTRQLAIARRLPERIQPVFVSHSRAVDTVRRFGFVGEHLPYHATYGEVKAHWNTGLAEALNAMFAFYKPRVVIFDGNMPFIGMLMALSDNPAITSVWIRRAMWGLGRDMEALDRAEALDLVVEPLDPAWSRDDGPTVARASQVRAVPPVRILDQAEMPSRVEACAALGLDPSDTNVLVATGAGNNFDMARITGQVIDRVHGRAGLGCALAEWQIAQDRLDVPDSIARLSGYPFSQYLSAFDAAVAAPGYNTFCEHLAAGLPTLWAPNENEQMDQQIERARYAVDQRCGLMVRRDAPFDVASALSDLLHSKTRGAMARAGGRVAAECMAQNGASEVAQIVTDLAVSSVARMPYAYASDTEDDPSTDQPGHQEHDGATTLS
ncbi:glycosyltransferase [Tateyamaria armeniaca]|uniref:Glycosyltransferase n=1 Tax=Tateyamaria armeniaca TaxID=2518930 RepID=A0ABW8USU3_9RHOB